MYFNIQIDAIPQGRPRFYNKVAVDPPKSRKFKDDLAILIKSQLFEPALHGAIAVTIHITATSSTPPIGITATLATLITLLKVFSTLATAYCGKMIRRLFHFM